MKFKLSIIFVLALLIKCSYGQTDNYNLDFKAKIKSNDGVNKLILFNRGELNSVIQGYVLLTRGYHNIEGRIKKGGFNFLDHKIFEVGIESLRKNWVKNNFPINDVIAISNGVNVDKVYSFEITPMILNYKSDSLSFYIKGVFYNLTKGSGKQDEYKLNYDVDFSYKLYKIPFDKDFTLDFFSDHFKNYKCTIRFSKINEADKELVINNNEPLFEGIKKSAK